jgi:hypothetical protein
MGNDIDPGEVILEFVQIGALIRVSAMEPKSLTEVVISGERRRGGSAPRRAAQARVCPRAKARSAPPVEPACRRRGHALELPVPRLP